MNSRKTYLLLLVSIFMATLKSDSQEIVDQLNRAKSLPYGEMQLNIISDILRSSGASAYQRQQAEMFQVYQDRQTNKN